MRSTLALLSFFPLLAAACGASDRSHGMTLQSLSFKPGGAIPKRHSCDGENVSPPLLCIGAPAKTTFLRRRLRRPRRLELHALGPLQRPGRCRFPRGRAPARGHLPVGAAEGANDFGGTGWGGPCPPTGEHHYEFRLYALDVQTLSLVSPTKQQLERAMEGHVLAEARLTGTYRRAAR